MKGENMRKIKGMYMVKFSNGVKIGISDDIKERLRAYKSPWCREIQEAIGLPCQYPKIVEYAVKVFYKDHTLRGSPEFIIGIPWIEIKQFIWNNRFKKHKGMFSKRITKSQDKWIDLISTNMTFNITGQ